MRSILLVSLVASVVACATNDAPKYVANFDPPSTPDGFTRYVTPVVKDITPGTDIEYCQWLAAPSDHDQDVLAMDGWQSVSGHHAVLYATTETKFAVGESHPCTVDDMISVSFIGGVGAEGGPNASQKIPAGLFFRVPAGQAIMVNTHWINSGSTTVDGQAVLDLKLAPGSDQRMIADIFANNGDLFNLVPGSNGYDVSCVLQQDFNFVLVLDHMHQFGSSAYSELIHPDGTTDRLVVDPTWTPEEAFNPVLTTYTIDAPKVAHAGDTYHTHCEWDNTGTSDVLFPDEMCVGTAFYFPSAGQVTCENGGWNM